MLTLAIGEKKYLLNKEYETVYINQRPVNYQIEQIDPYSYQAIVEGKSYLIYTRGLEEEGQIYARLNGKKIKAAYSTRKDDLLKTLGIDLGAGLKIQEFKAPMPGLIRKIDVALGETVQKGQIILVLEAMKMENALKSPGDGVVKSILVKEGQAVEKNQLLVIFE
jgi:biotin carboxyl carrier protein